MATPSRTVDALCDRLNGDRNLLIQTDNDVTDDHFCEAGQTIQNVAKLGMDIEADGQSDLFISGISTIDDLARTWCNAKGYTFVSVKRWDRLQYHEIKRGMLVEWKGEVREVFNVQDPSYGNYISMRYPRNRPNMTEGEKRLTWRLYDHQVNGGGVVLRVDTGSESVNQPTETNK